MLLTSAALLTPHFEGATVQNRLEISLSTTELMTSQKWHLWIPEQWVALGGAGGGGSFPSQ